MKKIEKSIDFADRKLTISVGHIAQQATSAVMVSYGETVVMATVVASELVQDPGYFPLQVEYQEKLFAGGKIKGSKWVKREGRPSDDEILSARLVDRSIRPLFPDGYLKDVQLILTVLSVDLENSPEFTASVAASAVLATSEIPWMGPIGTVKIGLLDNKLAVNPTESQMVESDLDLVVSSTKDAVIMIEAGGNEITETKMSEAIELAFKEGQMIIKLINDVVKEVKPTKTAIESHSIDKNLEKKVKELVQGKMLDLAKGMADKTLGYPDYDELKAALLENFEEIEHKDAVYVFEKLFKSEIRKSIFSGKRLDGRKTDELRKLSAEVGVLPRTHGSGLFQRGQTQALTVATLGSASLELLIETAEGEESKKYIHHYAMPPYSSGETGRVGAPKRREIGHGALAEKALKPVIPSQNDFPYTILVTTEILSSNGSTSMASVCGSTLSLMDAGVPIKEAVAGIAMGIVIEDKKATILTDIVGVEDGGGDMDFKVAGTKNGITALQLDVKTLDLTVDMLEKAFDQAKKARLEILKVMISSIDKPRDGVSKYAPTIKTVMINTEKIGELIGPGGKTIKGLSADTGAEIDVDDSGRVSVSAIDQQAVDNAIQKITALTKVIEPDEVYEGEVKRIETYGIFVEILPGRDGMVHVSDMSMDYVNDPNTLVKFGDKVTVRVKEVDDMGRINLTMIIDKAKEAEKKSTQRDRSSHGGGGRDRNYGRPRRDFDNRNRSRMGGRRQSGRTGGRDTRDRGGTGPHFPASRLAEGAKDFRR